MNNPFEAGGGTAFPLVYVDGTNTTLEIHSGMTLRDWFAGKAMQSLILAAKDAKDIDILSAGAYHLADAMLKERSKE